MEAEKSREVLETLIQQLLESNYEISRRLRSLEDNSESRSALTACSRNKVEIGDEDVVYLVAVFAAAGA